MFPDCLWYSFKNFDNLFDKSFLFLEFADVTFK